MFNFLIKLGLAVIGLYVGIAGLLIVISVLIAIFSLFTSLSDNDQLKEKRPKFFYAENSPTLKWLKNIWLRWIKRNKK